MPKEKLQSRSRAKKKMRRMEEINEFCRQEYDEEIELDTIVEKGKIKCECNADMKLVMEFPSYKIYICTRDLCLNRRRVE